MENVGDMDEKARANKISYENKNSCFCLFIETSEKIKVLALNLVIKLGS